MTKILCIWLPVAMILAMYMVSLPATHVAAGMDDCAIYSNSYCAPVNGSCYRRYVISGTTTTYQRPYCPSGTYISNNYLETCRCQPYTYTSVTLGTACNTTDTSQDLAVCRQKNPQYGDANYYWFAQKYEGDTCSGAFDCLPPRRCVNNKCYNRLVTGDTCYNMTSGVDLRDYCSIKDYCPLTGAERVCTARLAAGGDCTAATLTYACPTYQFCGDAAGTQKQDARAEEIVPRAAASIDNSGNKNDGVAVVPLADVYTCQTKRYYWIPAGQRANSSASDCYSNLIDNYTNMTCLDYTTAYNTWQSTYGGISCSSFSACGGTQGTCTCSTTNQGSTAATCTWDHLTPAVNQYEYLADVARAKAFYDAGCTTTVDAPTNSVKYCQVALGYYEAIETPCDDTSGAASSLLLSASSTMMITMLGSFITFITMHMTSIW